MLMLAVKIPAKKVQRMSRGVCSDKTFVLLVQPSDVVAPSAVCMQVDKWPACAVFAVQFNMANYYLIPTLGN